MNRHHHGCRTRRQGGEAGFSLIELLIAMTMGIAMVAIVLVLYQNLTTGDRLSRAQQQMNQDAQAAFHLLGRQMLMAAFNPAQPRVTLPPRNALPASAGAATNPVTGVFGCDGGFSNGAGASGVAADIGVLACDEAGSNAALAVQYEADVYSAAVSGGVPADCRGFAVPMLSQALTNVSGSSAGNANYYAVENRYFIANGGLSCTGNGSSGANPAFGTPAQPLVPNVESFSIRYGVRAPNAVDPNDRFVGGYLSAKELGPANASMAATGIHSDLGTAVTTPAARWAHVMTARVCIVVKSETAAYVDPIAEDDNATVYGYYYGCDVETANAIAITDRFPRKAYVMHMALRNRIKVPS